MTVVGAIGGITAISAALLGLVMTDIKRVLAYSTISQLGYMMLALGIGAYVAAIFHLMTHAFFKALLFLGSGSVNHATNTFDMRLMGGLAKPMRITFITFVIGALSLSGIFPLAGFWSKDEILSDAWGHERYLFWIALVTAGLTAFYMFRVIFLTFLGEYRGGAAAENHGSAHDEHATSHGDAHHSGPHESPLSMTLPLIVLAVPAIFVGFVNFDKDLEHLLLGSLPDEELVYEPVFRWGVAIASSAVAIGGIGLAWVVYGAKIVPSSVFMRLFKPVHTLLENKYYFDVLYERVIVGVLFYQVLGSAFMAFDRVIVDGAVNGVAKGARSSATVIRYVQNGQFQTYGALAFGGLVFTAIAVLVLSPL
jgi:NADH-quinone oxidoreductase subunit L